MSSVTLKDILKTRVHLSDGAFGTYLLSKIVKKIDPNDNSLSSLPDYYNLTDPELVSSIHLQYLNEGSDIICTNSLNSNSIGLKRFQLDDKVEELNRKAVSNARKAIENLSKINQNIKYIAGVIGPTEFSLTNNNSNYSYDDFKNCYSKQIEVLIDEQIDLLLIESIYDTKNSMAALEAVSEISDKTSANIPIWLSLVIDTGGNLYSGESITQFTDLVKKFKPLIIGLNCVEPTDEILNQVTKLSKVTDSLISFAPSAGIPDKLGNYPINEAQIAKQMTILIEQNAVNIAGGCCGTSPALISQLYSIIHI